jgi:hypothetical protein
VESAVLRVLLLPSLGGQANKVRLAHPCPPGSGLPPFASQPKCRQERQRCRPTEEYNPQRRTRWARGSGRCCRSWTRSSRAGKSFTFTGRR